MTDTGRVVERVVGKRQGEPHVPELLARSRPAVRSRVAHRDTLWIYAAPPRGGN